MEEREKAARLEVLLQQDQGSGRGSEAKIVLRNRQDILGSVKKLKCSFSGTEESSLTYCIQAHFPGYREGIGETNQHGEEIHDRRVSQRSQLRKTELRREQNEKRNS